MKGLEDFIPKHTNEDPWLTNFRNKEPAVRTQGRGCTTPPTAWALLGTPSGGRYPDPGYQHEGHHRLSPHRRARFGTTPELKSETRINHEERPASRAPEGLPGKSHLRQVPHNPVTRTLENPEGRYGMMTEKASALLDTYCVTRK